MEIEKYKINKSENCFSEQTNKSDKTSNQIDKWEGTNNQIWNKRGDVTTNFNRTERIKEYNKF